ncbi:MAG: hypothetical protein CMF50_00860 [Legionellales bacterium]|nr:hypothetical protein [Legionellales bacterium]|tara:strand:- start:28726 stop:29808 length:1083 start_codon:yes stop_codon:yes gene_type:complete
MKKHFLIFNRLVLVVGLLLGLVPMALATSVKNLYKASIPVESQSQSLRDKAMADGLAQVLVKVSGNSAVTTLPKIRRGLSNSSAMMNSYSYDEKRDPATGEPQLYLTVNFAKKGVDELLRSAAQGIWGRDRPLTVVWLAEQTPQGKQVIANDGNNSVPQTLFKTAKQRGLPIAFPLYDLEDMNSVGVNDVWTPFPWILQRASERYNAGALLTGRILPPDANHKQWRGEWWFVENGTKENWQNSADSADALATDALNHTADTVAGRFASYSTTNESGTYKVAVYGINSVVSYTHADKYLQNLNAVSAVEADTIGPDHVIFIVTANGGKQALTQAISVDRTLMPFSDPATADNADLTYRLRA